MKAADIKTLKIVSLVAAVALGLDAVRNSWREDRPIGGFFEEYVAGIFGLILPLVAFGVAVWLGIAVSHIYENNMVGWIVGIAGLAFFFVGIGILGDYLPGVSWRIDRAVYGDGY